MSGLKSGIFEAKPSSGFAFHENKLHNGNVEFSTASPHNFNEDLHLRQLADRMSNGSVSDEQQSRINAFSNCYQHQNSPFDGYTPDWDTNQSTLLKKSSDSADSVYSNMNGTNQSAYGFD